MELIQILNAINELKELSKSQHEQKQSLYRSSSINELALALAKAQAEMLTAGLDHENPYFKSKYADLASIVKASRPALTKHGLAISQPIIPNDDGQLILHSLLMHSSGQWIETRMRIIPSKNDIQTLGSTITYLRRYSYAALIGVVAANEDDDGEIAMVASREMIAKGPSVRYNPREQSPEVITKEQLEELEYELAEYPDIGEMVLDKLQLQSLADMPKSKYMVSLQRIREIKNLRNGVK